MHISRGRRTILATAGPLLVGLTLIAPADAGVLGLATPVQPISRATPVAVRPVAIALNGDAGQAFLADPSSNLVPIIDTQTGAQLAMLPDGRGARAVAFDPATGYVLTADANSSVSIFNTLKRKLLVNVAVDVHPGPSGSYPAGPEAIAIDNDRQVAYTANGDGTLSIVDIAARQLIADVSFGEESLGAVAVDQSSGVIYAVGESLQSHSQHFDLLAIDPTTHAITRSWTWAASTVPVRAAIALDATRGKIYLTEGYTSLAVDLAGGPTTSFGVYMPGAVAVDAVSGQIYLSSAFGPLYAFDAPSATPATIRGASSDGLAVDPATGTVYGAQQVGEVVAVQPVLLGVPPQGSVDTPYQFRFDSAGLGAPNTSIQSGVLPPGLTLAADGQISGTPTATGLYRFSITASGAGRTITDRVSLLVDSPTPLRPTGRSRSGPVAFDPTHNHVLAVDDRANFSRPEVAVLDAASRQVVRRIPVAHAPTGLAVDPGTDTAIVLGRPTQYGSTGVLTVISLSRLKAVASLTTEGAPTAIVVDSSLHRAYVSEANQSAQTGTLLVLDTRTLQAVDSLSLDTTVGQLAIDPIRHRIYMTQDYTPTITVVDGTTDTIAATVPVSTPDQFIAPHLAADPATGLVYVSHFVSSSTGAPILVLDESGAPAGHVVATGSIPGTVTALAIDPATGYLDATTAEGQLVELDSNATVRDGFTVAPAATALAVSPSGERFVAVTGGGLEVAPH